MSDLIDAIQAVCAKAILLYEELRVLRHPDAPESQRIEPYLPPGDAAERIVEELPAFWEAYHALKCNPNVTKDINLNVNRLASPFCLWRCPDPAMPLDAEHVRRYAKMPDRAWDRALNCLFEIMEHLIADADTISARAGKGLLEELNRGNLDGPNRRQREILQAMLELEAFDGDSCRTIPEIAVKAEGTYAKAEAFKIPMSQLNKAGYVESRRGRDGGCWLTQVGRGFAEEQAKR